MAYFYNAETKEPLDTMYIVSSGNGNIVLSAPSLSMNSTSKVEVANGPGTAERTIHTDPNPGETRWKFSGLKPGSSIVATDNNDRILKQIPVKQISDAGSYAPINKRFHGRNMKVELDDHIDYVCYASDLDNEGISFHPKSVGDLQAAITDTQLFHRDDKADFFGRKASSATIGEGYREVSTPSLHVAISSEISSVHIDSWAFQFHAPDGTLIIGPDAGQHIVDELWFRLPMTWLRRHDMPFLASVLQALHPVLPNSVNGYQPRFGIRVELGSSPTKDFRSGSARFTFETTVDFTLSTAERLRSVGTLRLLSGGDAKRSPDWVLGVQGQMSCRDIACRDTQESVMLVFNASKR
jgi:hypothetical protein